MTLETLLNLRVVTDDGAEIGKIFDFRARRQGGDVIVTHILVGAAAWVGRLRPPGWLRWLFGRTHEFELPWVAIDSVDRQVRLRPGWDRARCDECRVRPDQAG
jgi:hypothetical protein